MSSTVRRITIERCMLNGFLIEAIERYSHGVYVFYGSDNKDYRPLWIGESNDLKRRIKEHLRKSDFKDEIVRIDLHIMGVLEDKGARKEYERALIEVLKPKYNVIHNNNDNFVKVQTLYKMKDEDVLAGRHDDVIFKSDDRD
jgi:excinuclease UvrABC nuclease subunit